MGYSTDFYGRLELSKPLNTTQLEYLNEFSMTEKMKRDVNKLMEIYNGMYGHPTPVEYTPEGIYGNEGEYFAHGDIGYDPAVLDHRTPPGQISYDIITKSDEQRIENEKRIESGKCVPGQWCNWMILDNSGKHYLTWDGGEKFYNYIPWLKYLINHFFERWGIKLNGEISWFGEQRSDLGKIIVKDNVVKIKPGRIVYNDID